MNKRGLAVDVILVLWLLVGVVYYLRQFAGPGLRLLARILGPR